jgi:pyroglutamyl-peptidase
VRILVSGFGPFGPHTSNASSEVLRRLWEEGVDGADLLTIELPCVRYEATRVLLEAFTRAQPDAVVALGIAAKRMAITPERIAINVDDYDIPDNNGARPVDEPVVAGGPAAYFSTLPLRRIVEALTDAQVPAALSNSAGTYLCNHTFYGLMHHLNTTGAPARAGFVHIPQMLEASGEADGLPFSTIVRGVAITLDCVVEALSLRPVTRRDASRKD